MKVVVGSQNPVKIKAVENAFQKVFGDCQVVGASVRSGVSDMPMSFEETVKGAKTRAKEAIADADFGVGLEGGFEKTSIGVFLFGFAAVVDAKGRWGFGRGGGFLMPKIVLEKVNQGKELGDVIDELTGKKNTKQGRGAIGFFTNDLIPRMESFETAVILSLARFIKKDIWDCS